MLSKNNYLSNNKEREQKTKMQFTNPRNNNKSEKIVFLNASQNPNGNTSKMAKKLLGNNSYKSINLSDYNIPQVGQGNGDYQKVFNELKGAKKIVIGTPVYWSNISGYLKTFIDHMDINNDLNGADLYAIVQGFDTNQDAARDSAYGSLNRISNRFGLNFVGIASNDKEIKNLNYKLKNN